MHNNLVMAMRFVLDCIFHRHACTADVIIVVADDVLFFSLFAVRDVYVVNVVVDIAERRYMKPLEPDDGAELTILHALLTGCKNVY